MTYEATGRLLLTPVDKDAPTRVRRLRELGLGERCEPGLDAFADRLARVLDAPYAMVNFIGEERQFFAGLHLPEPAEPGADATEPPTGAVGRHMGRERGYCPHVVVRGRALVLEDVGDYPRFAGNPVVDEIGIQSYLGAPLADRTGLVLGTVCAADVRPRAWGRAGLDTIKAMAAELAARIQRREDDGYDGDTAAPL
ncbi:GAF domain-containing protein [Streptomyces flavofungini]|uniref:GAF domain-containing protein n=1 Tax=Streptomyces flavofungini TaxID=68200 RepID=A0ABS0X202_9ACTN|nr:GAF domain-containing protein [Streptomyces flavofungini]MBJ3807188.1 GAF domain-containing protein [Streptomyces flavofungini]GHC74492.1 histidine kinase [Streptomyces flavofungini]